MRKQIHDFVLDSLHFFGPIQYRISKSKINADEKLTGCFMHFIIGGITREVTTEYVDLARDAFFYGI
jgi:hypothetical protein